MIVIVDYGMGNLGSIASMLKKIGAPCELSSSPGRIATAEKLILPGVGAYDAGMNNLMRLGLHEVLERKALRERVPILGICLGMHLMTQGSDEGAQRGLGWMPGSVLRFSAADMQGLKVPHMGWNIVRPAKEHALATALGEEPRYYFVHSYYVRCTDPGDVLLRAKYGVEFHAAFQRENLMGVQFHPEKSHRFGMRLLKNFAEHC